MTYCILSEIERGIKNPTVEKLDELARAMNVHPLTLLTLACLPQLRAPDLDALQERVNKEAKTLLAKAEVVWPRKARLR